MRPFARPPRTTPARSGTAGVTLIEVTVAIAIVGIAMGTIMQNLSACAHAASQQRDRAKFRILAERQISVLRSAGKLTSGEYQGTFEEPAAEYGWKMQITTADKDEPFVMLTFSIIKTSEDKTVFTTMFPLVNK
jgi:prepilin-type N-terminal cleavage/methylation domain-containing protein